MRLRPELNWPYVIFCILALFLMCGAIAYVATFGPAAGKSPAVILLMRIGMDALCLGTVLLLLIQLRHDSQLELDDDGISKRLRHLLPQPPGKSEEQSASRAQEIGFCVVFVTLLALHLLFAWLQTVIDAAVNSRRKAAAAVHPARR